MKVPVVPYLNALDEMVCELLKHRRYHDLPRDDRVQTVCESLLETKFSRDDLAIFLAIAIDMLGVEEMS